MLNDIQIENIIAIAKKAAVEVMKIYKKDFEVEYKDDKSPLTLADKVANEIICHSLQQLTPTIPIMSEENKQIAYEIRKDWEYYWCIDPIDGTKEFIKKNDEFTLNIALIYQNTPVLGVVYAPAIEKLYSAKKGEGVFVNGKALRQTTRKNYVVVASKSHLSPENTPFNEDLKNTHPALETNSKGSSLKLCMVAVGEADIYPRLAPTMEWDTAAADAIVREAGKMSYQYRENFDVENLEKEIPMVYNKENLLNPWFVVV